MSKSTQPNDTLTAAIALVGGTLAVAAVGGGIGVVGAFGAVGIGAFEVFTGGALLSGAVAHTTQKNLIAKSEDTILGRRLTSLKEAPSSKL